MDFFNAVKRLAKERKNLSLQEFIISLGINFDSYYSLKRYHNLPRADEAVLIAQALGTTVEYLVTGSAPKQSAAEAAMGQIRMVMERYRKTIGS
jgi:hypothetical protein